MVGLLLLIRRLRHRSALVLPPLAPLLLGWLGGYLSLHWVLNVPVWDRYLLPAVPIASLATGWGVDAASAALGSTGRLLAIVLVLALMLIPAGSAAAGLLPLGGDHGLYDGIDQVAGFFADYPYGTVLYDHWLSWQLRYYLFDSRVYVSWFADSTALHDDLRVFGDRSARFLILPAWESLVSLHPAVADAGFQLAPAFTAHRPDGSISFLVYRLVRRP
jgi:hypothetical protein